MKRDQEESSEWSLYVIAKTLIWDESSRELKCFGNIVCRINAALLGIIFVR